MSVKETLRGMLCAALSLSVLCCCSPDPVAEPDFLVEEIYGTWRSGSLYYRYDYGYVGETWDEADDVFEGEGQKFEWKIEGIDMTHIYIMEMGAAVPKTYVIDELTPVVLRYRDDYGKYYKFDKVY